MPCLGRRCWNRSKTSRPASHTTSSPLIRRQITGVSGSKAWRKCRCRGSEAVCKVEQICQVQHPSVESWEGDMERLGPAGGDGIQPVVRPRKASGHRGDGIRVTAEVDRRAYRFFEAGSGAQGPDTAEPGRARRHR
jgi:hypothetical protein